MREYSTAGQTRQCRQHAHAKPVARRRSIPLHQFHVASLAYAIARSSPIETAAGPMASKVPLPNQGIMLSHNDLLWELSGPCVMRCDPASH